MTPWTVAQQAPLSMGFPRQAYGNELPFTSPGESSPPRDGTLVSCVAGNFFTTEPPGKPPVVGNVFSPNEIKGPMKFSWEASSKAS